MAKLRNPRPSRENGPEDFQGVPMQPGTAQEACYRRELQEAWSQADGVMEKGTQQGDVWLVSVERTTLGNLA